MPYLRRDSIQPSVPLQAAKPLVPVAPAPPSEALTPSVKTDSLPSNQQASGSAPASVALFDPPVSSTPVQAAKSLELILNQRKSLSGNNLPSALQAQIQNSLDQLKQKLAFYDLKQPQVRQEVFTLMRQLGQQLQMGQLMDSPVKAGLDQLSAAVIAEAGQELGLQLQRAGSLPQLSIQADANLGTQTDLLADSRELVRDLERNKAPLKKLTPETLLVMSLRDELLRRGLENIAPRGPVTPLYVDHPEEDLGIIRNAVEMADGMLSATQDLPPDLLQDFSKLTETISKAPPGKLNESLEKLREQSSASQFGDLGKSLQDLASQDSLNIPALQNQLAELNQKGAVPANIQSLSQNLTESLNKASGQASEQIQNQVKQLADSLTQVANQGAKIQVPAPINQLVDLAFQGVQSGPPHLGAGFTPVIAAYSQGMNAIESQLPPLWFPVTLPIPLSYNQGDTSFLLPAGSQLSQNHATGAYTIQSPGMYLQTGSTQVAANQAQIQLGNGLDQLQMNSLTVNDSGQSTVLSGVKAQIDRNHASSLIQADSIAINNESGQIQLENARMVQTPGSFELATDHLLYQQGQNALSADQVGLWQRDQGGVSSLKGEAQNLNYLDGQTLITADRMGFQMVQNENTGDGLLRFSGEKVAIQSGDSLLSAEQGNFDLITRADGSSKATLAAENANWQQGTQSVSSQGLASLELDRDSAGHLSHLSAQADQLNYANGSQTGQLTNGQLSINYHPNGSPSQILAGVGNLHWQDPQQGIDAQGVGIQADYSETGTIQNLAGKVDSLHYSGQGQQLNASQTQIQANWDENGQLKRLNAQAGQLDYLGQNGESLKASNAQLNAQFYETGQLQTVQAETGSLNLSQNGQVLNLQNAQASVNYRPDGSLQTLQGGASQVDWQNNTDQLQVENLQGQLNYGENGLLQSAQLSAGDLNYHGSQGTLATQGQSSLNLNYTANGQLQSAQGQIEKLNLQTLSGDQLQIEKANAQLSYGENGLLQSASASAGQVDWQSGSGDKLNVQGLGMQLNYADNGLLESASAQAGDLNYSGSLGTVETHGPTTLNAFYSEKGQLASLNAHSESVDFSGQGLQAHAENTTLKLDTYENGLVSNISGSSENLSLQGDWGKLTTQGTTSVGIHYTEAGQLSGLQAHSDQLSLAQTGTTLNLTGTDLKLDYGANGQLSQAVGSVQAGQYSGDFGQVDLSQGAVKLSYGEKGQLSQIQAGANSLNYAGDQGQLTLQGTQFQAHYGEDGLLENIHLNGEGVQFAGQTGQNQALNFAMGTYAADLTQKTEGGQLFHFQGQQIALQSGEQNLNLPEVRTLQLETGADGSISSMKLHLPDQNTYSNPDLNAALDNLQASYSQAGNQLQASFDGFKLEMPKEGLTVDLKGGQLLDNPQLTSLHLDSAAVVKQLEQELNVKVENVDLLLNKTETGTLASADLRVGQADALVSGMNLMVRTQNGDQVRLNMQMSEDGSFLREAFLQIPQGGEIKLSKDDLNLRLGGGQKLSFQQDGQGLYTFRGEGLDIDASTKDAKVQVTGGTAQISLDSKNGDLIIDEIKGTKIHAEVAGQKIDVDIKEMEGFLVKATGISGLAQGAALHLVPTSDSSVLTAEIRTSYNGIPIAVKFDNVHELKALATIETNRAHVYFGDPSGRGEVKISAGPLEMKGSAIEFVARYQQYDPQRMMSTLSRALSSDGYEIVKGVQLELDGVLRLQTPFKNGPHAGLTLLFPRPQAMTQAPFDPNPFSSNQIGKGMDDGAFGLVTELGWKHTNDANTESTYGVHAGLVPGSYLSIDQTQGSASLAGVPLPKHIAIPTTAIAGVTYRRHSDLSRLDLMAGGYLNPAGLAPSTAPISEPNKYGAYAGFSYREGSWQMGVTSTVDLSKSKPDFGAMVSVGLSF
ncbi:hypothetical protein COW36_10780 [bacterium (Candidatus Blackallbacteria) CG17_big_fil_post_rev_8_21_14_2_50_48_46]|uniref:Uncharacterized protein n=1 Tax=bacterium (Candidatus Blackallbacteria) CG17_big_fil_post_rev_8_21_14_2_50_48_46 TaxID=2014261 RepID=A0A2M7G5U1_9BACT|nr:MAG: hypothetical protein COW64_20540 [bacterium (Candidatus Blackallbacteria) CG18_big_fil_WC_8_21_14_2_50_49_26]PIW16952.1 MAG: hypothetical protein COW36_10780 [bacterium (Candidatus Blackallbacteria) CG17_big_fil_post_rev_8_21_14_2_50_48_46]PIW50231.1 MAG: hypothetical protein COW20_03295 [bacterium (Candidatus Blackallbacteria) CG13_big_fil_rev_8_21_14_2_50_49_14]